MKKVTLLAAAFFLFTSNLAINCAYAQDPYRIPLTIMTGGPKGTYYQFGLNMQRLTSTRGFQLTVVNSKGSVENIYAVYKRPNTQMGIVQSDVLAFVAKVHTDPVLKRIAKKIKMVFPLYNEEIHLLGKPSLTDFDALANKRVAIGKEGSGTYLTAKLLFEVTGIEPAAMETIGTDEALSRLKSGEIDAMFYVAGYPVKLFSESVTAADNLKIVPITTQSILDFYPSAKIPANTYPWQEEPVKTAAVKSVLVSFDFRRANCDFVGRFAKLVYDNVGWLQENGHPKWKTVDLDYPLKGWEQYDCVKRLLETSTAPAETRKEQKPDLNPVLEAIKDYI